MTAKLTLEITNDLTVPTARTQSAPVSLPAATPDDSDGDGLPDAWERLNGLNPSDPTDAAGDQDGDGITNLEEFRRGTSPQKRDAGPSGAEPCHPLFRGKSFSENPTDG